MKHLRLALNSEYQIVHDSTSCFKIGEKVFLKSNPKITLTVTAIQNEIIEVSWTEGSTNKKKYWPPQCLLQYKYAGLIWWKDEEMCLN